jgi:hypothetical protein
VGGERGKEREVGRRKGEGDMGLKECLEGKEEEEVTVV